MLRMMTKAAIDKWHRKVAKFRGSPSAEDRIVGILMDMSVGGSGGREDTSRVKAKEILRERREKENARKRD